MRAASLAVCLPLLCGVVSNVGASSCDARDAVPSTRPDSVFTNAALDFGQHAPAGFPVLDAVAFNAGYGRWSPFRPVLTTGGDIIVNGNVCLDGDAHANGLVVNGAHFLCGADRIDTWTDGSVHVDLPAAFTEPDSFPGATYYFVTVADGPGNLDSLMILDRNQALVSAFTYPTRPHPDVAWAYDKSLKKLVLDVKPTTVFDQAAGPFPALGADTTVVVNFGGFAGGDHLLTDLTLQETGSFEIRTTLINTRFTGTTCAERRDQAFWTGGATNLKQKATFGPKNGLALIAKSLSGNAQAVLGTTARPATVLVTGSADLATGQWPILGSLWCLGAANLGGGVTLTYDTRPEAILPPGFRPPDQAPLGIVAAAFSGPDAGLFELAGGFAPAVVLGDSAAFPVRFRSELSVPGGVYDAVLDLTTTGGPFWIPNPTLHYALTASRFGTSGPPDTPAVTRVVGAAPNPFRDACTISFELAAPAPVTIEIADVSGRIVRPIAAGERGAGRWTVTWNGRTESGEIAAAGRYFARIRLGDVTESRAIVLLP